MIVPSRLTNHQVWTLKWNHLYFQPEKKNELGYMPVSNEKEIRKFYKKPSNKSRIEDDLLEKKILDHLIEYAKIKEVSVATKELRGANHEHWW